MNGNTQFGTASPNGQVNTDGWLDQSVASSYSAGILSGFAVAPQSTNGFGLNVGGTAGTNDVAVAVNSNGDRDTLGGHSALSYVVTLPGAPGTSGQSQVYSIVAYKDTTVTSAVQNGVDSVGVTYVAGTAATTGSQAAPTDSQIRAAIANGSTMFYAVVANVTLAYGATSISAGNISQTIATLHISNIPNLNQTITTTTNSGSAGGSMNTISLFGLKIAYGVTNTITAGANSGSSTMVVTFPAGFFTATPAVGLSIQSASGSTNTFATGIGISTISIQLVVQNNSSGTAGGSVGWIAVGH